MRSETIARAFKILSRAYPDYASKYLQGEEAVQTIRLYQRALDDVPDDVLEAAVLDHIANCPFWPKVSDLRKRCFDLMAGMADLPTPYEAWAKVRKRLKNRIPVFRNGKLHRPRPLPPLIEKAVMGIGGWDVLAASENGAADRARFIEAYTQLIERERRRAMELPAVRGARQRMVVGQTGGELEEGNGSRSVT